MTATRPVLEKLLLWRGDDGTKGLKNTAECPAPVSDSRGTKPHSCRGWARLCLFKCCRASRVCPLPGPSASTAPSFGTGTFQSHSSGAAADTPLSITDSPAGGGTPPFTSPLMGCQGSGELMQQSSEWERPAHLLWDVPAQRRRMVGSLCPYFLLCSWM